MSYTSHWNLVRKQKGSVLLTGLSCLYRRYETSTRKCYFMRSLPVLTEHSDSTMYMRSCTSDTTIQG